MIFGRSGAKAPDKKPTTNGPVMPTVAPLVVGTAPPTPSATQNEPHPPVIRYVDRPDVAETFADAIGRVILDGQTLRIEFAVTRVDQVKDGETIRYSQRAKINEF